MTPYVPPPPTHHHPPTPTTTTPVRHEPSQPVITEDAFSPVQSSNVGACVHASRRERDAVVWTFQSKTMQLSARFLFSTTVTRDVVNQPRSGLAMPNLDTKISSRECTCTWVHVAPSMHQKSARRLLDAPLPGSVVSSRTPAASRSASRVSSPDERGRHRLWSPRSAWRRFISRERGPPAGCSRGASTPQQENKLGVNFHIH